MQVLLWHTIEKLGKRGDIVTVKDGYARNFLIPRRMASLPTSGQYREFEVEKRRQDQIEVQLIDDAKQVETKLAEVTSLSMEVNTNEDGVLYGSVTPTMIAQALLGENMKVDAKCIEILEPIKNIGTYEVTINLHREVKPTLKVWVLSTKELKVNEDGTIAKDETSEEGEEAHSEGDDYHDEVVENEE
ncbi:MAG: 50S ribosomal protein L9 [Planctomycetota bacterium]|jgi:large subunit ribosomal protein L9|nr:50S ribosomal protein L9 [Planctomycetota bacterium]